MTGYEFIEYLKGLNPKLLEKDFVITAPNGLQFTPVVKQQLIDKYDVFGGDGNVDKMVITHD